MAFTPGQRVRTTGGLYSNRSGTFIKIAGPLRIMGMVALRIMGMVALDGDKTRKLRLANLMALDAVVPPPPSTSEPSDQDDNEGWQEEASGNPQEPAMQSSFDGIPHEELEGILSELNDLRDRISHLIQQLKVNL